MKRHMLGVSALVSDLSDLFLWARGCGGTLAWQQPRAIRVGPNQEMKKIGVFNILSVYILVKVFI